MNLSDDSIDQIYESLDLSCYHFTWSIINKGSKGDFVLEYIHQELLQDSSLTRCLALVLWDSMDWNDAVTAYNDEDYLVLTTEEVDDEMLESAQSYLYEVVLPEIPEYLHYYFNEDTYIKDYINDTVPGEVIADHDGAEHSVDVDGTTYYIYRK